MEMTEEQKCFALGALENAQNAVENGRPWAAEQWAESAATMIREANLSGSDTGRLVAPREGATTGDKVAIGLSACVLVWMLASMLSGLWTL